MKFTAVLALVAAATVVSASTNAERLARGLPPNAPAKRATPALRARHSHPSGTPMCSSGPVQCCNSIQKAGSGDPVDSLLTSLGLSVVALANVPIGLNCDAVTVIGATGGSKCTSQTACCDHTHSSGLVNINCSPINIGAL